MPLMKAGHHAPVYVLGSVLSKSSQNNPQVVVSFKNDDGDTIDAYLSFTEAAAKYTEAKLKTLGYDLATNGGDIRPLNRGAESPLAGFETEIDVKEETYNEKTTVKVDWIGPRLGSAPATGSEEDLMAEEYRRRYIARNGAPKTTPKPGTKANAAGPW